jgi:hypothetical protein
VRYVGNARCSVELPPRPPLEIKAHLTALLYFSPHPAQRTRTHSASTLDFNSTVNHSKMKYTTVCAAFFAAVATASDVKQLKTDNFKSFIEENDLVLAECKSLYTRRSPYT